jgi:hypothetical protein
VPFFPSQNITLFSYLYDLHPPEMNHGAYHSTGPQHN